MSRIIKLKEHTSYFKNQYIQGYQIDLRTNSLDISSNNFKQHITDLEIATKNYATPNNISMPYWPVWL